jgi:hypothetical protein
MDKFFALLWIVMVIVACNETPHPDNGGDPNFVGLVKDARSGSGDAIRKLARMAHLIENDKKLNAVISTKEIEKMLYDSAISGDSKSQLSVFINGKSGGCYADQNWKPLLRKSFENGNAESGYILLVLSIIDEEYSMGADEVSVLKKLIEFENASKASINSYKLEPKDVDAIASDSNLYSLLRNKNLTQRALELIAIVNTWYET